MKIVHVGRLQRASGARKAGYLEAHQKIGRPVTIFGQPFLQLTDGDYAAIRKEFALVQATPVRPVTGVASAVAVRKPKMGFGVKQKHGAPRHEPPFEKGTSSPRPSPPQVCGGEGVDDAQDGSGVKMFPKMPALGAMAKNAAGAAGRVISAAVAGQSVQASEEVFQRRMEVCMRCEFLDKGSQRCGKCGCFVAAQVIGKARLATERCPERKW